MRWVFQSTRPLVSLALGGTINGNGVLGVVLVAIQRIHANGWVLLPADFVGTAPLLEWALPSYGRTISTSCMYSGLEFGVCPGA